MGRKRRHRDRDSSERILKKLERKLRKRRRISYSSSTDRSVMYSDSDQESNYRSYYTPSPSTAPAVTDPDKYDIEIGEPYYENLNEPSTSATDPWSGNPPPTTSGGDKNEPTSVVSEHLDIEILTILGDAPKAESSVGQEIHADIATRLQDVLLNGLKKENKEKITEEYPIPANCPLLKAPILNAEVKAAVSDILLKKDASLAARQAQIGTALTALTRALSILVNDKSETSQVLLKHVSNACRLLCDSHYIDTKMRRNFLISTLNNKLKDTLKDSKRDEKLFGEGLSENLKATKAINKSSLDLKSQVYKPKAATKNSKEASSSNHLNWRHPQSNQQNTNRRALTANRQTAGTSTAAHRSGTARKPPSGPRAHRTSAHYRDHKRS